MEGTIPTLLGLLVFLLGLLGRTMLLPYSFLCPRSIIWETTWQLTRVGGLSATARRRVFCCNADFPICQQSLARTLDNKRMVASHRRHGLSALFEDGFRRTLLMIKSSA